MVSRRELFASLGPAALQDDTSAGRPHARKKTVLFAAASRARLECSFRHSFVATWISCGAMVADWA